MTLIEKIGAVNAASVVTNPKLKGSYPMIYQPEHATVRPLLAAEWCGQDIGG